MKKIGTILILILVAAVVGISGCTDNGSDNNTTKNYSANGYTFEYPSNWTVNDTDASSIIIFNGTKYDNTTSMIIFKMALNGTNGTKILNAMRSVITRNDSNNILSNKTITYQNTTAYEYILTSNDTGINATQKVDVIFFVKGDNLYMIGIETLESDFDTLKSKFETFKNSLQIQ